MIALLITGAALVGIGFAGGWYAHRPPAPVEIQTAPRRRVRWNPGDALRPTETVEFDPVTPDIQRAARRRG